MKTKIIISLILVGLVAFSYGLLVGHYQIFPYAILSEIKNSPTVNEPDARLQIYQEQSSIENLISFNNAADIDITRQMLNQYLWNEPNLPNDLVSKHEYNIDDAISSKLNNLQRIDLFTVEMDYKMNSNAYLFLAENSKEKLIIYHQGHNAVSLNDFDNHSFDQDIPLIQHFLDKNYSVLILSMPGKGMNNEPIINHEKFGTLRLNSHNHFEFLENENFHPMRFFVEPVIVILNQIEKDYSFEKFSMIGLSGGGWTTIIVAAIDERINESYSVAGSFPIWLRSDAKDFGDYEQTVPEFYQIANYQELYFLSDYGKDRHLTLFYNEFDSCCFSGSLYNKFPFGNAIKTKLSEFEKSNFDVIVDYGETEHIISDKTLETITLQIEKTQ